MIDSILNSIWEKITGGAQTLFTPFQWIIDWSPMFGHITVFVVFLLICGFIARFLPDKFKLWLAGLVVIVGAFIAGETYRFKRTLDEAKADKAKTKPKPKPPAQLPTWRPWGS